MAITVSVFDTVEWMMGRTASCTFDLLQEEYQPTEGDTN